jgi:hypothetical protein
MDLVAGLEKIETTLLTALIDKERIFDCVAPFREHGGLGRPPTAYHESGHAVAMLAMTISGPTSMQCRHSTARSARPTRSVSLSWASKSSTQMQRSES